MSSRVSAKVRDAKEPAKAKARALAEEKTELSEVDEEQRAAHAKANASRRNGSANPLDREKKLPVTQDETWKNRLLLSFPRARTERPRKRAREKPQDPFPEKQPATQAGGKRLGPRRQPGGKPRGTRRAEGREARKNAL